MLKKTLTLAFVWALIHALAGTPAALAAPQAGADARTLEQVKIAINRAGTGERARVTVKMKDGTERKGYVSERREAEFVLRDGKTDRAATIAYNDVARVHVDHGHSTARHTAIGVGIGVGAVVLVLAILIAAEFN